MSHPLKSNAATSHTAKLRRMTAHYGSASGDANNIKAPQEMLKGEGPEADVGFGADSSAATARSDRPARRTSAANPLATYARGGKVKARADGGETKKFYDETLPEVVKKQEGQDTKANPKYSTGGVIARARGGRAKHGKGSTHVNVIVAPQGAGGGGAPGAGPSPQLAALVGHPPMPPMAPPPGAGGPPGGPPMMSPPGGPPPMRARGGKVMGDHPDASKDKELINDTLKEEGLIRKAKGGGITMKAGAATGIGRLEKMGHNPPLHRGSMAPKEV